MTLRAALAIATLVLATPCLLVCAQDASKATQPDNPASEPLQGRWEGIEVGREAQGKCTLTIAGDSMHFQGANKGEWYQATFALPPATAPAQLRATIKDCPAPEFIGKSAFAIYKFEAGTLTLVGHAPGVPDAPKDFEGDTTSRSFVFKKAQPQKDGAAHPVRQRFVPAPYDAAKGNGASFSALRQLALDQPGVLMLMAHAGIGDSFPVREEHLPKEFDVIVVAGDDDQLKLEVRTEKGSERYDLKRDGTVSVQIAGHQFMLSYPSTTVSSDGKSTTDKAMIIVNRLAPAGV